MRKKRGVLVVLVIVLLLSLFIQAEEHEDAEAEPAEESEESPPPQDNSAQDPGDPTPEIEKDSVREFREEAVYFAEMRTEITNCAGWACSNENPKLTTTNSPKGSESTSTCSLAFYRDSGWDFCTDKWFPRRRVQGTIADSTSRDLLGGDFSCHDVSTSDGLPYICGSRTVELPAKWARCSSDDLGKVTWTTGNQLWNCSQDPDTEKHFWNLVGIDQDRDGFTNADRDCDDQPSGDPATCPRKPDECSWPKDAECAICIGPHVREIAGDGVDNDCKYGEIDDPDQDVTGVSCFVPEQNDQDESFAFKNIEDGNRCCGDDSLQDFGHIGKASETEWICLKKDPLLVGSESDLDTLLSESGENWAWFPGSGNKGKVLTVKEPGKEMYDVVSDSVKWHECKAEGKIDPNDPNQVSFTLQPEDKRLINHFYCYQEGQHWSWAECFGEGDSRANENVKGRNEGDHLYALFLDGADADGITPAGSEIQVDPDRGAYADFYRKTDGGRVYFDFTGYDQLEFYIQFEGVLFLPADLQLTIWGPVVDDVPAPYLERNILGDALSGDLEPEGEEKPWIHVQIPIPNQMDKVSLLKIKTSEGTTQNQFKVRNLVLTKSGGAPPKICSGTDDPQHNSWIDSYDDGTSGIFVTAEKMCKERYGKNAWLGDDSQVDRDDANCCGNNKEEYYSGKSRPVLDGDSTTQFGCWNSKPIGHGKTTMNVEYTVDYKDKESTFDTSGVEDLPFDVQIKDSIPWTCPVGEEGISKDELVSCTGLNYMYLDGECISDYCPFGNQCWIYYDGTARNNRKGTCFDTEGSGLLQNLQVAIRNPEVTTTEQRQCPPGHSFENQDRSCASRTYVLEDGVCSSGDCAQHNDCYIGITAYRGAGLSGERRDENHPCGKSASTSVISDLSVGYSDPPLEIGRWEVELDNNIHAELISNNPEVDVYFFEPLTGFQSTTISPGQVSVGQIIYVMARASDEVSVLPTFTDVQKSDTFRQTCSSDECLYALPGFPPYTVKNDHPDLYELYFVTGPEDRIPIGRQKTHPEYANLLATKVAQQIMYVNEDDIETTGFYGCQAADFLPNEFENVEHCTVPFENGPFCSFSVAHGEGFTTINSWDTEPITQVGYEDIDSVQGTIGSFFENFELKLKPANPGARSFAASVLPARNFIPNAIFQRSRDELPHWELLEDGVKISVGRETTTGQKAVVKRGETLRSERIAVPKSVILNFAAEMSNDCATIKKVDKDGLAIDESSGLFSTDQASYVVVEFEGPCEIEKPNLQLVDDFDPIETEYKSKHAVLNDFDARQGAACCPRTPPTEEDEDGQGYCWNGYACVEPMGSLANMAEHIADGRDYRCIDGEWEYQPVKYDWNAEKWGFCKTVDQCFVVTDTVNGASAENALEVFYEDGSNAFPTCIENGDSAFDHYCDQGNWTSRTKFLAKQLIDFAADKNYVLYCGPYKDLLLDYENTEQFLGGGSRDIVAEIGDTPIEQAAEEAIATCFDRTFTAEDKPLISEKENTCINNVCVLKWGSRTAFATTLNKPINDSKSFLQALDVNFEDIVNDQVCPKRDGFVKCETDIPGDLWYLSDIDAVVYSKEGIAISPNFAVRTWRKLLDFFGLFSEESELADEVKFVTEGQNYKDLFLLKAGGKKVRAIKEVLPGVKETLVVEYEGFNTPVCDYVNNIENDQLQAELLEVESENTKVSCTTSGNIQKVEAISGLDFLWPQLTGKIRVSDE